MNQSLPGSLVGHILAIPRGDRWRVYHRLQELLIPCWCSLDGYVWVEVNDPVVAAQVRSVVQQFFAPRQELVDWLEQCWQIKFEKYQSN